MGWPDVTNAMMGYEVLQITHFPGHGQDKNGCLVVQEALESATWEMQMPIMTELKGKVCLGPYGSFWDQREFPKSFVFSNIVSSKSRDGLVFLMLRLWFETKLVKFCICT